MEYGKIVIKAGEDIEKRRNEAMNNLVEDIKNEAKMNVEHLKKTLNELKTPTDKGDKKMELNKLINEINKDRPKPLVYPTALDAKVIPENVHKHLIEETIKTLKAPAK